MMNNPTPAVLLSVRPQWCEKIANGEKTLEVRKNRPKVETPFKCYIYQTKPKDILLEIMKDGDENYGETYHGKPVFIKTYGEGYWTGRNQKVIGEFVCDETTNLFADSRFWLDEKAVEQSCLTGNQIREYANGKESIYGWHISALQIYDKPKELSEFKQCDKCPYGPIERCNEHEFSCDGTYSLIRPPQSWCYVEALDAK